MAQGGGWGVRRVRWVLFMLFVQGLLFWFVLGFARLGAFLSDSTEVENHVLVDTLVHTHTKQNKKMG